MIWKKGFLNTPSSSKSESENDGGYGWGRNRISPSGKGSGWNTGWHQPNQTKYKPPPPPKSRDKSSGEKKKAFVTGPFLPKSIGSPKAALNEWYAKRHKKFTFYSKVCFASWDNGGPAHDKRFTSVFRCPLTGEQFMSGSFGSKGSFITVEEKVRDTDADTNTPADKKSTSENEDSIPVVWHRQLKHAEHAAAARALDCFSYREGGARKEMCYNLCPEEPYLRDKDGCKSLLMPVSAPESLFTDEIMIEINQDGTEEIENGDQIIQDDVNMNDDEMFRSDYVKLRKVPTTKNDGDE